MFSIREVRTLALTVDETDFVREIGPFTLIQKPAALPQGSGTMVMGLPVNARATMMARPEKVAGDVLAMLFQFEDLIVANLPPISSGDTLIVGRAPDCELVIDDPSVSKRHAQLKWNGKKKVCTLQDLGSTNGTYLNASIRIRRSVALRDGDIISFGEAPFWFLLTTTLYERLSTGSGARKLGGKSG